MILTLVQLRNRNQSNEGNSRQPTWSNILTSCHRSSISYNRPHGSFRVGNVTITMIAPSRPCRIDS